MNMGREKGDVFGCAEKREETKDSNRLLLSKILCVKNSISL